jgi:transcriptional regulator GlxA family with amidase domain
MNVERGHLVRITGRRLLACFLLFIFLVATASHAEEPTHVGFLVLDHVYNSELMAPYDVFHHTVFHTKPGMKVFTVSLDGKSVTTFEGLRLQMDYSIANTPAIDVLVIPSAEHNMDSDLKNAQLKNWVTSTATKARYVVTLCDGAFILANTGLLNGKKATTFPSDVAAFRKLFPQVQTQEGYSFVHDGKFLTSQGGARSYDVAMYLVDLMYGEKVAAGVGKGLVLPWPQPDVKYLK